MTEPMPRQLSRRAALKGGLSVALALPAMTTALAACSPEQAAVTSDYAALITRVSDLVLPQTDTPGAVAAGVPDYVRAVVGAFLTEAEQAKFKSGLTEFDALARAKNAKSFLMATSEQQVNILTALDSGDVTGNAKLTWQQLKDMIVFGYYTSEVATEELPYEEIPGRYIGNVPFAEVGRAWLDRGV